MSDRGPAHETPMRRNTIKYGGAVVGGGSFAGYTDSSNSGSTPTESDGSTATETAEPTEEVQFDQPPERVTHYFHDDADVSVALGDGDSILSMRRPSRFHTSHYDELDGVSVDADIVTDNL